MVSECACAETRVRPPRVFDSHACVRGGHSFGKRMRNEMRIHTLRLLLFQPPASWKITLLAGLVEKSSPCLIRRNAWIARVREKQGWHSSKSTRLPPM